MSTERPSPATSAAPGSPRPERLLIVGPTEVIDGVGRFNSELVRGLVHGGHDVRILTLPTSDRIEGATNIELPSPPKGLIGLDQWEGFYLTRAPQTLDEQLRNPTEWSPSAILLHGKFRSLGPYLHGIYPDARLMQVAHNLSYHTEHHAVRPWSVPGFQRGFSRAMRETDVAVGVGPLLTSDLLRVADRTPALEVAPPIATSSRGDAERHQRLKERRRDPAQPFRFLLYGRLGDVYKGADTALHAIGLLRQNGFENARLTFLGVPDHQISDFQERMNRLFGKGVIECAPYSHENSVVQEARERADAVLMPSVMEAFGLVATEALGEGIPVLIPEGAGAAQFLTDRDRFPEHLTQGFIVRDAEHCRAALKGGFHPAAPLAELWASAMADMIDHYPRRLAQSTALRDRHLVDRYTARNMADAMVSALRDPDLQHVKQGPGGTLLRAQDSRVLPVSVGPTLESLHLPADRQTMHYRALEARERSVGLEEAVRRAGQGRFPPAQRRPAADRVNQPHRRSP